uniref:Retrotransposon gag domain-containing protein n=1 Tax=Tanacetum cinerariifolium TaxID=118510 RepID=A0A6L2NWN2_TANCI|nr:hypothetical protein [Tanacetum cinerariifolium]
MGDENPIRTLRDYSKPSHAGYRNITELPVGNNVVPFRSDTIWLMQNGCSFHRLWSEDSNQHLKDFLKLVGSLDLDGSITTWEDLMTRFLAQFFPSGRTVKLCSDILMFQQHHRESLSETWTRFKDSLQKPQALGTTFEALVQDYMAAHTKRMERFENAIFKQREEINDRMIEMFGLLKELTTTTGDDSKETDEPDMEVSLKEAKIKNGAENRPIKKPEKEEVVEEPNSRPIEYYLKHRINEKLIEGLVDNNRPAETDIRLSLASQLYIYPLGIVDDVLVEVVEHVYPVEFVILDIKEDKRRPFILETPFLTTANAVIKFDKVTITLRSGNSKISFIGYLNPQASPRIGRKDKTSPGKEIEFDRWRSKNFKDEHPALTKVEGEMDDEGEVGYLAFGRHLEKIHVPWAHLEKKRTRLWTYTNISQDYVLRGWRRRHKIHETRILSVLLETTPNLSTRATRIPLSSRREQRGSITTWEDLTTRFLVQFFPPGRTVKLRNDILMFQQHHGESLSDTWTHFKDSLQKVPSSWHRSLASNPNFYDHVSFHLSARLTAAPEKVLIREEAKSPVTKSINSISLIGEEEEKKDIYNVATDENNKETDEPDMKVSLKEAETKNGAENRPIKKHEKG